MQMKAEINNIKNTMLLFNTKSKQTIEDFFKWKCQKIYNFNAMELILNNQYMSLPIVIENWRDIDNDIVLENVFIALLRITDPKGGRPGSSLATALIGYDCDVNMNFIFCGHYCHGKHSLLGYYENGQEMIYQEKLSFSGVLDKEAYNEMKSKWE